MTIKERLFEFFKHEPKWYIDNCLFEIVCLSGFTVAFVVYFNGKGEN
jgi:hypothetical protein